MDASIDPTKWNRNSANPVHLNTLITVIRTGSFADAARQLGYTSSAVSQQIQSLERSLKVHLFERDARSIRPTHVAELLASRASSVLVRLDTLLEDVNDIARGVVGTLAIGSFPTANRALIPEVLTRHRKRSPGIRFRLDEGEPLGLVTSLLNRDIDIAFVYDYDLVRRQWPDEFVVLKILEETLLLLVPDGHPVLSAERELALNELRNEPWITTRDGTSGAKCLERLCGVTGGFEPRIELKSNDYDAICSFVKSGFGVALVPALSYRQTADISVIEISEIEAKRHVYVLHRGENTNPAIPEFLEQVKKVIRDWNCSDPI